MNLPKSTEGTFALSLLWLNPYDFAFVKTALWEGCFERGCLISAMSNASELLLEGLLVSVAESSTVTLSVVMGSFILLVFGLSLSSSHESDVSVLSFEAGLLRKGWAPSGTEAFLRQIWKIHLSSLSAVSEPKLEKSSLHVTKPFRKVSATSKHLKPQKSHPRPLLLKCRSFSKNFVLKLSELCSAVTRVLQTVRGTHLDLPLAVRWAFPTCPPGLDSVSVLLIAHAA